MPVHSNTVTGREKWFEEPLKNTVGPWSWFGFSNGLCERRQD